MTAKARHSNRSEKARRRKRAANPRGNVAATSGGGRARSGKSQRSGPVAAREAMIAAIRSIPRGKVSTYGAIARAAGYPRGARLVASVLRRSYGLPWQRVLGAGGEIKLRGDSAIEQRLRLEAEGVTFRGRRVNMREHGYKLPIAR